MLSRIAQALLYGFGVFAVLFIIGLIVTHLDTGVGSFLERIAPVIGLLVGLYVFITGNKPTV